MARIWLDKAAQSIVYPYDKVSSIALAKSTWKETVSFCRRAVKGSRPTRGQARADQRRGLAPQAGRVGRAFSAWLCLFFILAFMTEGILLAAADDADVSAQPWLNITTKAINVFLASCQEGGMIEGIDSWQVANGYTAIALHEQWSSFDLYKGRLRLLLDEVASTKPDFIDEFNDDSMWWAMANLELLSLTNDQRYLTAARRIYSHVEYSVIRANDSIIIDGKDMQGAVLWNTRGDRDVNTITTGLFAELGARLACYGDDQENQAMVDQAQSSLSWILRCRYDEDQAVVLDTINLATHDHADWTFTYTTGQAIAASVALFESTFNSSVVGPSPVEYLDLACHLAWHAMARREWVDEEGILLAKDEYPNGHELWQNNDAVGFKSILVRSLAKLYRALEKHQIHQDLQIALRSFVHHQFYTLQTRNSNGNGQYGPYWNGPFTTPTSHSQLAVLDVMAAVYVVQPQAQK